MNGRNIFEGPSIFDVNRRVVEDSVAQITKMSEQEILNRTTDDIIEDLKSKYTFDVPRILEEEIYTDQRELKISVRPDHFMGTPGGERINHYVDFHIPFSGDSSIFGMSPSNRRIFTTEITIEPTELVIPMRSDGNTADGMKANLADLLQAIKSALNVARADFAPIHQMIAQAVRPQIDARRSSSLKSRDLVASLGFPMKRRPEAPTTFKAPDVRRKIVPSARVAKVAPFKPEPTLEEAEYQHILSVMDNMTKVMERSPHTFVKMGEEDIRQHFLVQLNGQYEGGATGETFNAGGKTDIIIRSDGANIFIAECKFWHGEKGFLETVDQLLSYVTWRDTKTAVVIFNRNKSLSGVVQTIREAMERHPHKKRGPAIEADTRVRYVFGHPNDTNREIIVTVLVYDIPTSP